MISIRVIICIVFSMFITLKIAYGGIRVVNILRSPGAYNSCECNEALGSITVEASGTAGPFVVEFIANFVCADVVSEVAPDQEYEPFRNVNGQITVDGLCPGSYSFKVTDNFGCVTTLEADMQPCAEEDAIYPLIRSIQPIQNSTSNDGILEVSSGTGNSLSEAMIEWSGPNGFSSTEKRISGLSPGKYDVTVTSACGSQTASFDFTSCEEDPIDISADIRNTCPGFSAGRIELPRGTIAMWDDGASGFRRRDLSKGTYGFNATDRRGCKGQGSYSIQESIEVNNVWNRCTLTQKCFEKVSEPANYPEINGAPRNGRCEFVGRYCSLPDRLRWLEDKDVRNSAIDATTCRLRIFNEITGQTCRSFNGIERTEEIRTCGSSRSTTACLNVKSCNFPQLGQSFITNVQDITFWSTISCSQIGFCLHEASCGQRGRVFCRVEERSGGSVSDLSDQVNFDHEYTTFITEVIGGRKSNYLFDYDSVLIKVPLELEIEDKREFVTNLFGSTHSLSLKPNPVVNAISLGFTFPIKDIWISDLMGRRVKRITGNFAPPNYEISVSDLNSGIYFVHASYYDGVTIRVKFVKMN